MELAITVRSQGVVLFIAGIIAGALGLRLATQLRARRLAGQLLRNMNA